MFLLFALVVIDVYILMTMRGGPKKSVSGGEWTVYGTMGCGWTVKQLEYMKKNGTPFTFVDCKKGGCDGIKSFPTLVSPTGEKIVGFSKI